MIIQSLKHRYAVIREVESTDVSDIFLCRDETGKKENNCMVVRIKNQELIRSRMPLLLEQCKSDSFSDFRECFSRDGILYCVFRYYELPTLCEELETVPHSIRERMELTKSLFSEMVRQDMNIAIQTEALHRENLVADKALGVHFNYILRRLPLYGMSSFYDLQKELSSVLKAIFSRELEGKMSDTLERFIQHVENGSYRDYMDLYRAYHRIYEQLQREIEEGSLRPHSFFFALWDRIKQLSKYVKPVLSVLLIIAALVYLVWYLKNDDGSTEAARINLGQIGTVTIDAEDSAES